MLIAQVKRSQRGFDNLIYCCETLRDGGIEMFVLVSKSIQGSTKPCLVQLERRKRPDGITHIR